MVAVVVMVVVIVVVGGEGGGEAMSKWQDPFERVLPIT